MRDLVLLIALACMLPLPFIAPHAGVLIWGWISFMSPHSETWGIVNDLRLNLIFAVLTIVAWLISREPKRLHLDATAWLIILFAVWITVTTMTAIDQDRAWRLWNRHIKSFIFILIILALTTSRVRVHALMWIIAISLGYWSVRGGIFSLVTGGQQTVFGPEKSMIRDNNHLALALVMSMPVLNYLRQQSAVKFVRYGLLATMGLTLLSVLISYSRGGILALAAAVALLWVRSRAKALTLLLVVPVGLAVYGFVPEQLINRIQTLGNVADDGSFQGRVDAWLVSARYAIDHPLVGAGFSGTYSQEIFARYNPDARDVRAAHSIYFQVLGDHGFVGLGIFLAIAFVAVRNASWIVRATRGRPELYWARDLAMMLQISLCSYFVAGAALSMAYYDVYFVMVAVLALTRHQVEIALAKKQSPATAPRAPVHQWST